MVRQSVRQSSKGAALSHRPRGVVIPDKYLQGTDAVSDPRLESETFVIETAQVRELPQMRKMCEMREAGQGRPQSPPGAAQGKDYLGGAGEG